MVDYRHWNAHSIFFLDPAGNVVDDVVAAAAAIGRTAAVAPYRGGSDAFQAMGDEYGLLLVMKRGRIIDFTSEPHNAVRVYPTGVTIRGAETAQHQVAGYPYRVTLEARCACG